MATVECTVSYRCSDDCVPSGCPGHKGRLVYQSVSDAYVFNMNERVLHFERGELDAMLSMLNRIGRFDCAQIPKSHYEPQVQ